MEKTLDQKIKQATEKWVGEFNAIPVSFIENALGDRLYDEFYEITPDFMVCFDCGHEYTKDEFEEMSDDGDPICKNCSEKEFVDYQEYQSEVGYSDYLPMWGTMWTFNDRSDGDWALDNIETMYKCGFRVYENDDLGVVIGIDGAGYNFYEAHWIPLYKARGLRWHEFN
mgnify:FL=1